MSCSPARCGRRPKASWSTASGGALTLARAVVDPPGEARADWRIIAAVARAMGYEKDLVACRADLRRWRRGTRRPGWDLRGASYERLRGGPVQWPVAREERARAEPDQVCGPAGDGELSFPTASGRAVFYAQPHLPPAEMPDDDFPFVLNTGRLQHQSGTR